MHTSRTTSTTPSRNAARRRGAVYLFVLITAMIVTVLGVGGVYAAMADRAGRRSLDDAVVARRAALSAIEVAISKASNTASFRRSVASAPVASGTLAGSAYSVVASDPTDADTADSIAEPLRLVATASHGVARSKVAVKIAPRTDLLSCLDAPLSVSGPISFSGGSVVSDTAIFSNTSITANTDVYADTASVGAISGTIYTGARSAAQSARAFPTPAAIFALYTQDATAINFASTGGRIEKFLISPQSNPYGTPNPAGVYVIDCRGADLELKDLRVRGTLVLLNLGPSSKISGRVAMEPAVAGYPCLVAQGNMRIDVDPDNLREQDVNRNLNPPGDPFAGSSDSLIDDTYPSLFSGVVYISGDVEVTKTFAVEGAAVVGGRLTTNNGALFLRYKQPSLPPPGFQVGSPFTVDRSSWAQVVD